jgi:hypothetical protein
MYQLRANGGMQSGGMIRELLIGCRSFAILSCAATAALSRWASLNSIGGPAEAHLATPAGVHCPKAGMASRRICRSPCGYMS